jgi:hypothetical protein
LHATSRLEDVGEGVQLRSRSAGLADEDVDSAEEDLKTVLNRVSLRTPARIIDVEIAATTLGHPAEDVSLESWRRTL